jgi:type II secretory pathway predicted ATPase ExeA
MLALKKFLQDHGIKQAYIARQAGISPATIAQLLNKDLWPVTPSREELQQSISQTLTALGVETVEPMLFEPVPTAPTAGTENETTVVQEQQPSTEEVIDMLPKKQTLTPQAMQAFGLFRDPFKDDVQEAGDLFLTPDARAVHEHLWATAKHGGFLAIAGESGSGKSTLVDDMKDRIYRENAPIILIEPSVRRMEDNDKKGKTLKSGDIEEAIIYSLDPTATPRRSAEARARQVASMLEHSARARNSHVILIEEAHSLPVPTLKHLKRFTEIKAGFTRLLNVILIGQTELKVKLSGQVQEVREVVQRCELVELPPLDAHVEGYLRFKFDRVGGRLDDIFDTDAMDALRGRLIFSRSGSKTRETVSLMYPLTVNNLVTAAMNRAVQLGFAKVSGDLIREV